MLHWRFCLVWVHYGNDHYLSLADFDLVSDHFDPVGRLTLKSHLSSIDYHLHLLELSALIGSLLRCLIPKNNQLGLHGMFDSFPLS